MRVHKKGKEAVVALCDEGLMGRILSDGKIHIDLQRFGSFYSEKKVAREEAVKALAEATSVNAVGKEAVELVKGIFNVGEASVIKVAGVPHIQIYKL